MILRILFSTWHTLKDQLFHRVCQRIERPTNTPPPAPHWVTRWNTDHPMLASDVGLVPQLCSVRDRARVYPRYSCVQGSLSNLSGPYSLHQTATRWEVETISCQRSTLEAQTEHRWGDTRWRRVGSNWTAGPRCSSLQEPISWRLHVDMLADLKFSWPKLFRSTVTRGQKHIFNHETKHCVKTAHVQVDSSTHWEKWNISRLFPPKSRL